MCAGGQNATGLIKFLQQHDDAQNLKMALVSQNLKFIYPEAYFGVCHGHLPELKLETSNLSGQVDSWAKIDGAQRVTEVDPNNNTLTLSNGKQYTYKALVLAPGFDHHSRHIKGLEEFENGPETNNVYAHCLDSSLRVDRNWYHGWNNAAGDLITYSPKHPYKGEGCDFYSLYYEQFLRQDRLQGRALANSRVQFWTPNKSIFKFGYANEVALDECHKRGIEVHFGWEMLEMKSGEHEEKIAVFRNVDSGEIIEKEFNGACVNPPSTAHEWLVNSGLTQTDGLVDVNRYTLQHNKYENVFAFGDCIGVSGETTRTQSAATAQNAIVKNNVLRFLHGKEPNAIWDGYTFMPLLTGHSYATSFAHHHDFEPAKMNHWISHYGIFGKIYFNRMLKSNLGAAQKYGSFKKNSGPPHWHYSASYDELEHNQYLQSKGVPLEEVRHPAAQARAAALEPATQ